MPRRPQGQPVTISTTVSVTDPVTGVVTPTTPGTILLRVRKPDLTYLADFTSPTNTGGVTGKYHVNLSTSDLATLGQYRWAWITTGTAAGASPRAGIIDVVDPFAPAHISAEDVKARLNVSATDDEIQDMIDSAISEQENRVGPVAPRSVTRVVYPSSGVLLLPAPVISITSITPAGGSPLSLVGLDLSGLSAGIVRPGSSAYWWSATAYTVVYVAGRNPVPQDLVEAALKRVQFAYDGQRGGSGGFRVGGADLSGEGEGGSSFTLILDAQRLEAPYTTMPAVA